jgi:hypothetical protein
MNTLSYLILSELLKAEFCWSGFAVAKKGDWHAPGSLAHRNMESKPEVDGDDHLCIAIASLKTIRLLQGSSMQPAPARNIKDVAVIVHDVPKSEHDPDAGITMHPVTGAFMMHPAHESAASAKLFRLAFPSHTLQMFLLSVPSAILAAISEPSVKIFWGSFALCCALGLIYRVLLHQIQDHARAQRIGVWAWTALMLLACILGICGYATSPYEVACNVSRKDYVPASVGRLLLAVALALTNGTLGMSFGHKTTLIALIMASDLIVFAVCGKAELVLMLSEMTVLFIGYVVAHTAELLLRHSLAEKVLQKRRMENEKRRLQERNEQLEAEKERLLYDMQRPGRPLDDIDERNAIRRGLHVKTVQAYPAGDADSSETAAPSESTAPSFPPGPPSSSGGSSAPLTWEEADQQTQKIKIAGIVSGSVTKQKVTRPLADHQSPAEIAAAPATKRKAAQVAPVTTDHKLPAWSAAKQTTKHASLLNPFMLKVAPLTWVEADRQHQALRWAEADRQHRAAAGTLSAMAITGLRPFGGCAGCG